ncbi:MAG: hypothetical protein CV087_01535 [Candidatus Brocadia sp. WS118]|nr:MAG: hypothetical protein CV087_01535 [Candidatus Brocadia sp. WS118]
MKKIVIIVLSVVLGLFVCAAVAPFVIDLNKHKGKIIEIAKPYLARNLDFTGIKLTIVKGLGAEIEGLKIAENPEFGTGDFLSIGRLRVKVKFLPLLRKEIQVKELILDKPVIQLIKNAQGEFNFNDLMGSQVNDHEEPVDTGNERNKDKEDRKGDDKTEEKGEDALFAGLAVSTFTLHQGRIDFIDEFTQQDTPTTTTIDLLDIKLTDVSLDNPIHLSMAARLPEGTKQNFTIQGTMGPLGKTIDMKRLFIDITLRTKDLSVDRIVALYPSLKETLPKDANFSGLLDVEMLSKGNIDNLDARCTMDLKDIDIIYGETFRKPKLVPCQISVTARKTGEDIQLDQGIITMHTLSLTASGKVSGFGDPHFDLSIGTDDTSLKGWESLVPVLREYEPEGNFILRTSVKGTLKDATADVQFSSPRLAFRLPQSAEKSQRTATGKGFFESMDMKVQAVKKNDDIKGTGNLEVTKGEIQAAAFEKMQAQFNYQNNILGIQGFQVHTLQGDISMNGTVETKELQWSVKPVVKNINLAEATDKFTQYAGLFKGTFSGSFAANNAGDDKQKGALNASGSFQIDQGEIMNVNLVDTVMESLFGIKGISTFLKKEGSELEKQKITRFDSMGGDFSMASNKINVKKVAIHNIHTVEITNTDARIDGLIDCPADRLDLKGKLVLSQEYSARLAKKAEPLNALLNSDNRMVLPISITGSLGKPTPILDIPYVTSATAKYYGKKELEKLGEKIGLPKKGDKEQQGEDKDKKRKELPIGNILKDILK